MDSNFNLTDFIMGIIIKGIILGVVLAIAWPVKQLCDKGAIWAYMKVKELPKKRVVQEIDKKLVV
jgi:hypothetical protein